METDIDIELSEKIYRKTAYMGVKGITVSKGERVHIKNFIAKG